MFELEEAGIVDIIELNLQPNLVTVSLLGNKIADADAVLKVIDTMPNLKAIWLNGNPVIDTAGEQLLQTIEAKYPNIELWNSKFTKNATDWAIKFVTFGCDAHRASTTPSASLRYLKVDRRDVFKIADLQGVFAKFPKLRHLSLKDHELDSLEATNAFFKILKTCPKIRNVDVEHKVYEIIYELHKLGKLAEVSTSLKAANGFSFDFAPIQYEFIRKACVMSPT